MKIKLPYVILVVTIFLFGLMSYSQGDQGPPQPGKYQERLDPRKGPCGALPDNAQGNPPPPPPGLCLPINDYLIPMLLTGILLGSVKIWSLNRK